MAGPNDVFLKDVPKFANPDDVEMTDPTSAIVTAIGMLLRELQLGISFWWH